MSFRIAGLAPEQFSHLVGLDERALRERGVVRRIADGPGYPCRVTLRDAAPGESLLLLNYESHDAPTPYRSSYAIFVNERASAPAAYENEAPPVMRGRPIALRHFDSEGMLIGASLALRDDAKEAILAALANEAVRYIHAHNAAHGCFAAKVERLL